MNHSSVCTILVLSTLTLSSVSTNAKGIETGLYTLETRTLLPHLEEMRRNITTETTCLQNDEIRKLFPILKQPGLVDCTFSKTLGTEATAKYTLQCPGKNAAKGTAILNMDGKKISAELNAKLGGKNMTFTQFSNAILVGKCAQ